MKPQHLLLMALGGVGLGAAWYVFAGSKKSGEIDYDAPGYQRQTSLKEHYETERAKYQAILDHHNKTKKRIALAPGVSFDEQGNIQTTMPILIANPKPPKAVM